MGDCVFFFSDFQLFYNEHMFITKEKRTIFKKHNTIRLQGGSLPYGRERDQEASRVPAIGVHPQRDGHGYLLHSAGSPVRQEPPFIQIRVPVPGTENGIKEALSK